MALLKVHLRAFLKNPASEGGGRSTPIRKSIPCTVISILYGIHVGTVEILWSWHHSILFHLHQLPSIETPELRYSGSVEIYVSAALFPVFSSFLCLLVLTYPIGHVV